MKKKSGSVVAAFKHWGGRKGPECGSMRTRSKAFVAGMPPRDPEEVRKREAWRAMAATREDRSAAAPPA